MLLHCHLLPCKIGSKNHGVPADMATGNHLVKVPAIIARKWRYNHSVAISFLLVLCCSFAIPAASVFLT
jgi:hypothetical protein